MGGSDAYRGLTSTTQILLLGPEQTADGHVCE